ncbi:MAG: hypothetical protein H5T49_02600 [Hadesarchaea archaeon]|nr:hypothetical protein [Hadesarchaea archaeon]
MRPKIYRWSMTFLAMCTAFSLVLLSSASARADLSFEQSLTDWTIQNVEDSWPSTSHEHVAQIVTYRYSEGSKSLRGGSKVVGDYSPWYKRDLTETIFWTDYQDLRNLLAIKVDMTDIQRQTSHYSWGYGMEISLVLSDGVNQSRSLLWCRHEERYWLSGIEDNPYEFSFIGADGTTWYRYGTTLTPSRWGSTDFGGGPLANVNLAHAKLGLVFSCVSWHSSPQTLWVNALVDSIQLIRDVTPPAVAVSISGTAGNNGWYTSDVVVTLTATDGEKGVDRTEYGFDGINWSPYISPVKISSEGETTFYYRSFDKGGNLTSSEVLIKIDKTPPTISASSSPEANSVGWNNGSVTVHFEATDDISGLESLTPDVLISTEGINQTVSGVAVDKAGNSASITLSEINIDFTAPVVTINSPEQRDYLAQGSLTLDFSAIDELSGVLSLNAQLDGTEVVSGQEVELFGFGGRHSLIVSAVDLAGNLGSKIINFRVVVPAKIDIDPDTLNLKSNGGKVAVTAYIELPAGYIVDEIDIPNVRLDINGMIIKPQSSPICVGDHDGDGVTDLMTKFSRQEIIDALGGAVGNFKVVVAGEMKSGCVFSGEDILRAVIPGK